MSLADQSPSSVENGTSADHAALPSYPSHVSPGYDPWKEPFPSSSFISYSGPPAPSSSFPPYPGPSASNPPPPFSAHPVQEPVKVPAATPATESSGSPVPAKVPVTPVPPPALPAPRVLPSVAETSKNTPFLFVVEDSKKYRYIRRQPRPLGSAGNPLRFQAQVVTQLGFTTGELSSLWRECRFDDSGPLDLIEAIDFRGCEFRDAREQRTPVVIGGTKHPLVFEEQVFTNVAIKTGKATCVFEKCEFVNSVVIGPADLRPSCTWTKRADAKRVPSIFYVETPSGRLYGGIDG